MTEATPLQDTTPEKIADAGSAARTKLRHVTEATSEATRQGLERLRETGDTLRHRALDARDATVVYVREEPVKAVLIAAAAGAALAATAMAISRLLRR